MGVSLSAIGYFFKTFDETPHIYHSWWRDGQRWDYVDPVVPADLGPRADNTPKTNRIETYVECKLSIDETDFLTYFSNDGNNQTPAINELGLVAFDRSSFGDRATLESLYRPCVKPIIDIAFTNDTGYAEMTPEKKDEFIAYLNGIAHTASETLTELGQKYFNSNLQTLGSDLDSLYIALGGATPSTSTLIDEDTMAQLLDTIKTELSSSSTISVIASYDQYGNYQGETDSYMEIVDGLPYVDDNTDEAQRIKLITYYTFKSIPIEENWETVINYRIYAN